MEPHRRPGSSALTGAASAWPFRATRSNPRTARRTDQKPVDERRGSSVFEGAPHAARPTRGDGARSRGRGTPPRRAPRRHERRFVACLREPRSGPSPATTRWQGTMSGQRLRPASAHLAPSHLRRRAAGRVRDDMPGAIARALRHRRRGRRSTSARSERHRRNRCVLHATRRAILRPWAAAPTGVAGARLAHGARPGGGSAPSAAGSQMPVRPTSLSLPRTCRSRSREVYECACATAPMLMRIAGAWVRARPASASGSWRFAKSCVGGVVPRATRDNRTDARPPAAPAARSRLRRSDPHARAAALPRHRKRHQVCRRAASSRGRRNAPRHCARRARKRGRFDAEPLGLGRHYSQEGPASLRPPVVRHDPRALHCASCFVEPFSGRARQMDGFGWFAFDHRHLVYAQTRRVLTVRFISTGSLNSSPPREPSPLRPDRQRRGFASARAPA